MKILINNHNECIQEIQLGASTSEVEIKDVIQYNFKLGYIIEKEYIEALFKIKVNSKYEWFKVVNVFLVSQNKHNKLIVLREIRNPSQIRQFKLMLKQHSKKLNF